MSLDEPRNAAHAHAIEVDTEEEWMRLARLTEADDRRNRNARLRERDLCESDEAQIQLWRGIFAAMPPYIREIRYQGDHG